nr:glucose 1-dehydrogenase [Lysinibacillus timonensis]
MMFNNKVVIVTGAAQGIGKEIAIQYAKSGANVVLADMNKQFIHEVNDQINQSGYVSKYIVTDVRKEEDVIELMKFTVENYSKIDVLINNAGIFKPKPPYDLSIDEWDNVINTNLRSVFLCSREAAKYMRLNAHGGSIISMASTRATMSEPNTESYAATKGGIVSLTHALARSFASDKIRVNCISPGWIETGDYESLREIDHTQHLSQRVGRPADIAKACFYLSDPNNDFVTGINLTVDGGMTKKMIYEE